MTTFSMAIDGLLIMISGAAALYCWQLNSRLKGLHNLKSGVGEAIMSLSASIKASQSASEDIKRQIQETLSTLNEAVDQVEDQRQAVTDLLDTLDGQLNAANVKIEKATKAAASVTEDLDALVERSRVEMNALRQGVEIAGKVNDLLRTNERRMVNSARVKMIRTRNGEEEAAATKTDEAVVTPPKPAPSKKSAEKADPKKETAAEATEPPKADVPKLTGRSLERKSKRNPYAARKKAS